MQQQQAKIKTLYIPRVKADITEADIAQVFHENNIGQISEADLVTRFHKNGTASHKMAFITMEMYYDTDEVDELVNSLTEGKYYKMTIDGRGHYWKLMKNTGKAPKRVIPGTFGVLIAKAIEGDEETRDECARQIGSCFNKLQEEVEDLRSQLIAIKNMLAYGKEEDTKVVLDANTNDESNCPIKSRIKSTYIENPVIKQGLYDGEQVQDQDGTTYTWSDKVKEWSSL